VQSAVLLDKLGSFANTSCNRKNSYWAEGKIFFRGWLSAGTSDTREVVEWLSFQILKT